jgi:hypothetical protein
MRLGRIRVVILPVHSRLKKGKEPRNAIQMHQSPSQMIVNFSSMRIPSSSQATQAEDVRGEFEPKAS